VAVTAKMVNTGGPLGGRKKGQLSLFPAERAAALLIVKERRLIFQKRKINEKSAG
jgi:hypothetical protein